MTVCQKFPNDKRVESRGCKIFSQMRKLLLRAILATLGASSLVTGLQSTALAANLTVLSQLESGINTLSSESLRGVENRTNPKDYLKVLSETKPLNKREPILLSRDTEPSIVQIPTELLDLIKRVEINTGGSSLDSDEAFKARYRMDLMMQPGEFFSLYTNSSSVSSQKGEIGDR